MTAPQLCSRVAATVVAAAPLAFGCGNSNNTSGNATDAATGAAGATAGATGAAGVTGAASATAGTTGSGGAGRGTGGVSAGGRGGTGVGTWGAAGTGGGAAESAAPPPGRVAVAEVGFPDRDRPRPPGLPGLRGGGARARSSSMVASSAGLFSIAS